MKSQDFSSISGEVERDLRFRLSGTTGPRPIAKYFFIAAFFLLLMVAAVSIGIYVDSERAEFVLLTLAVAVAVAAVAAFLLAPVPFEASVDRQVECRDCKREAAK